MKNLYFPEFLRGTETRGHAWIGKKKTVTTIENNPLLGESLKLQLSAMNDEQIYGALKSVCHGCDDSCVYATCVIMQQLKSDFKNNSLKERTAEAYINGEPSILL
ncbi:MAG: hypothetical protein ABIF85_07205 [Nanoarchaeota archaeon]|nr:hypothetical protein [Nanoarchaeota archaeon]MBU4300938.1 hypothetical protein [Nanoarchaeota archaeon]MBU4451934.1 hypothetical protein [Nanoarchaeota archaeon]MCG2723413.1 hypothetical protein [archaeon]